MIAISVSRLDKFYGEHQVLEKITFDIQAGEHVGLLGANGAGKTTLFRVLTGQARYESGSVVIPPSLRIGILEQLPEIAPGGTAESVLRGAFAHLDTIKAEMEGMEAEMADAGRDTPGAPLMKQYGALTTAYETGGGYDTEYRLNMVCNGLGITREMRARPYATLSGGERTRTGLARLILQGCDILLLDEPTNHLDMQAAEWLGDYLSSYKGTVVAVSHDRYFLNQAITRVLELENRKMEFYEGNYDAYAAQRAERRLLREQRHEREQAEQNRLLAVARRMHDWAGQNAKMHRRAFAVEKRAERIEVTEKPHQPRKMKGGFETSHFGGDDVLRLRGICKAYGGREILRPMELAMRSGERIALIGNNGTGKTTLIKILTEQETPDSGMLWRGPSVKWALLPQEVKFSHPERSLYDTLLYELGCSPQEARNRLAAFGFRGEEVFDAVSTLSGGERSRLRLCLLMDGAVNFLLLDEPTNHLDIPSREWMESAIEGFEGALLFVSHDRYFINRFASRIWALEDGAITDFHGGYESYRASLKKNAAPPAGPAAPGRPQKTPAARSVTPWDTAERLEKDAARLESEIAAIARAMEEAAHDAEALHALYMKQEDLQTRLDAVYNEWAETADM
jgi:ATPase subunit of ABC transporter with duplicated ATPase domains